MKDTDGVDGTFEWLFAPDSRMVNIFDGYGADVCHIPAIDMTQQPAKLEDQLRAVIRRKHFSYKTEETYVGWYRRFVLLHGKRHPGEMGAREVEAFLTHLAENRGLVAVTQN